MKVDLNDFLIKLLTSARCNGIHVSGDHLRSTCPFHKNTKNSSVFSIDLEHDGNLWRCFSCHEKGNIIHLISRLNGCTYRKAQKQFLNQVIVDPLTLEFLRNTFTEDIKSEEDESRFYIDEMPDKNKSKEMIKYMEYRNKLEQHNVMDVEYIIKKYGLYYCDSGRYARRIIMPIRDINGRTIYMTNRSIDHSDTRKNIFPYKTDATKFVYGLYESRGKRRVFIVEGPFDMYQLASYAHKHNIKDVGFICLMGTEMTNERASIIASNFEEAYLFFDHEDDVIKGHWTEKGKFIQAKEDSAYNILSEFMPTFKMTKYIHNKKEPSTCNENQLKRLFKIRPKKKLNIVEWY